jgi:hypothetical protein
MADDLDKTALDRRFVAMSQPHEIAYWTAALRVSKNQLREAVKAVGNSADKVRAYVKVNK